MEQMFSGVSKGAQADVQSQHWLWDPARMDRRQLQKKAGSSKDQTKTPNRQYRRNWTVKQLLKYHRGRELNTAVTDSTCQEQVVGLDELEIVNDVIVNEMRSEFLLSHSDAQEPAACYQEAKEVAEAKQWIPLNIQGSQYQVNQHISSLHNTIAINLQRVSDKILPDPRLRIADLSCLCEPRLECQPICTTHDASFHQQLHQVQLNLMQMSNQQMLTTDSNKRTLLHRAVLMSSRPVVFALAQRMVRLGTLDKQDVSGKSALHLAVEGDKPLIVQDLLYLGASVCIQDSFGKTPLHVCAENNLISVLQAIQSMMLDGATVALNMKDVNGLTPMHYVVENLSYSNLMPEDYIWKAQVYDMISSFIHLGTSANLEMMQQSSSQ